MSNQSTLSRRRHEHRGDRGNVLPITLVFLAFSSLVVLALLTFSITLFRNRPPLEARSDSFEAVRSATRMAITMQRSHGPEGCYQSSSGGFDINGRSVDIQCTVLQSEDETGGRYGLISTSAAGLPARSGNAIAASGSPKSVRGSVFVNGGNLGAGTAAVNMMGGDLSGAAPTAFTNREFRYAAIPTTTRVDVGAAATCATAYGPNVVSTTFGDPQFGTTVGTVRAVRTTPPLLAVDVTRSAATTELLGVIVYDSGGRVVLDRNRLGGHSFRVTPTAPAANISQVVVCSQPATPAAPNYIPTASTFCGSPLMVPELFAQPGTETLTCANLNWSDIAGWKANVASPFVYPMLPQIPTYQRSSTPVRVGTSNCYVFYPGRYNAPLDLNAGNRYYFASGVYLFENEVLIRQGSEVVGGDGKSVGCTFDAEASFLPGSPRNHGITGDGVTFLLGATSTGTPQSGRIRIDSASLRLNQRIATNSTRASSGISIMTVNRASLPGVDPVIPANDRVLMPGCLQSEIAANPQCVSDIATYSLTPIQNGTPLTYTASRLTGTDLALDVNLNGGAVTTNRFEVAGAIFTPNAAVDLRRTATTTPDQYKVLVTGGITASTMKFDFAAGDSTRFLIGEETATVYQRVELRATANDAGRQYVSSVRLELDNVDRYAINSWTVSGGQNSPVTTTPTTVPPTATTTTVPTATTTTVPTATTTTVPATTTTTVPATTTTTTVPATTTTTIPCPAPQTSWAGQYWNDSSAADRLVGTPDFTRTDAAINFDWGTGAPAGAIGANDFSARWTRDVAFTQAGTYRFSMRGDDGMRLFIRNNTTGARTQLSPAGAWTDQSATTYTFDVPLTACTHRLEFEFYENGGEAVAQLSWVRL